MLNPERVTKPNLFVSLSGDFNISITEFITSSVNSSPALFTITSKSVSYINGFVYSPFTYLITQSYLLV